MISNDERQFAETLDSNQRKLIEQHDGALEQADRILQSFVEFVKRGEPDLDCEATDSGVLLRIGPRRFEVRRQQEVAALLDPAVGDRLTTYAALVVTATEANKEAEIGRLFVSRYHEVVEWTVSRLRRPRQETAFRKVEDQPYVALAAMISNSLRYPLFAWALVSKEDHERLRSWQAISLDSFTRLLEKSESD